jgi:hypothetical protein
MGRNLVVNYMDEKNSGKIIMVNRDGEEFKGEMKVKR